jgi:hypothetical protein
MSKYQLFDSVVLLEPVTLFDGVVAPMGATGAIVEVYNDGEAYDVEIFGNWVKQTDNGELIANQQADAPDVFMETLGVATLYPQQVMRRLTKHEERLLEIIHRLPEERFAQVVDFAEFLSQKIGA